MPADRTLVASPSQLLESAAASAELDVTTPLPAAVRVPGYTVGPLLGKGGMGAVYQAEQTHPVRRTVALKVTGLRADPETLRRFEAERQLLARMDHPHIARVFDAGTTADGRPYFAMELVRGRPLTEFCDAQRLPLPARVRLLADVCAAVQHAHQKGVLHRDLKPGNVLVEEVDGAAVPKVIDFGLAKVVTGGQPARPDATRFGMVVGTPLYMAPEQATGDPHDIDTRADVFALGVMLYELVTGRTPLEARELMARSPYEALQMVRGQEPPSLSAVAARSDAAAAAARRTDMAGLTRAAAQDLNWVALKAVAPDRERRYPTAAALADDLRRWLADEPVTAAPPSRLYRARKFVVRNRPAVAAAAGVLAALLAGLAGTGWGLVRAQAAEGIARAEQLQAEADRDRAARAEKQAAEQRGLALATVRRVVEDVNARLKGKPGLGKLREDLLRSAGDGLAAVARAADTAEAADDAAVQLHCDLGDVLLAVGSGRTADAAAEFEKAASAARRLVADGRPGAGVRLVGVLSRVFDARAATGNREAANAALAEMTTASAELDRADPDAAAHRLSRAVVLARTADVRRATGDRFGAATASAAANALLVASAGPTANDRLRVAASFGLAGTDQSAIDWTGAGGLAGGPATALGLTTSARLSAAAFTAGLAEAERASAAFPDDPGLARETAVLRGKLGQLRMDRGEFAAARPPLFGVLADARRRRTADPDDRAAERDLMVALSLLGKAYVFDGRAARARELWQEAAAVNDRRMAADPTDVLPVRDQVAVLSMLAQEAEGRGDYPAAAARLGTAVGLLEKVPAAGVAFVRERAMLDRKLALATAVAAGPKPPPTPPSPFWEAVTVRQLEAGIVRGDAAGAAAAATRLAEAGTPFHRYDAACAFARAAAVPGADRDRCVTAAVELLTGLAAEGYFDWAERVDHFRADADFNPVRGDERFRRFADRLGRETAPGPRRP